MATTRRENLRIEQTSGARERHLIYPSSPNKIQKSKTLLNYCKLLWLKNICKIAV